MSYEVHNFHVPSLSFAGGVIGGSKVIGDVVFVLHLCSKLGLKKHDGLFRPPPCSELKQKQLMFHI